MSYEKGDTAPKVVASGMGAIADKIINTAKDSNVPLYEDGGLADTLSKLSIGENIPPELYDVVAEILVFVNDMDKIKSKLNI